MKNIGDTLKRLREENGLTRKEAADKLKNLGIDISDKTLYGYESGRNSANADMFLSLCKIYKCNNIMETFSETVEDILFTNNEWEMVEKYRDLDPHGKEMVDFTLLKEWERSTAEQEPESKTSPTTTGIIPMRFLSYYQRMASAGSEEFLFSDIPTDVIAVPDTPLSRKADFVIGVNGRSMEDTYFDGDKVLVEKASDVPIGEIGIFIRGSECFIKEAGKDRLISHNVDKEQYPDIIPDERRIDAIGIVLEKVGD